MEDRKVRSCYGSYGLGDDVYVVNVGRKALTMRDIQERFTPRYR